MSATHVPRVLAVEDNPETQLLLEHLLGEDYHLTVARDVDEALLAVKKAIAEEDRFFDLLLLDIHLGKDRSGIDLLHLIRKRGKTDIPAIAVTAYAMPGDEERLRSEGFDHYVSKPFTQEEFEETLKQALAACPRRKSPH